MKNLKLKHSIKDSRNSIQKRKNPHFLSRKKSHLSTAIPSENRPARKLRRRTPKQHVLDANILSATELKRKYRLTYNTWRNTKNRTKEKGIAFAPEFMTFVNFLKHLGPRPHKHYTLDRLDNNNPAYGPGLCQWKDKQAQANNRSSTIHLTYKGECLALTVWARKTAQSADTMRKRRLNGWTDEELIEGKRILAAPEQDFYPDIWPGDLQNRRACERDYKIHGEPKKLSRAQYGMRKIEPDLWLLDLQIKIDPNGLDAYGNPHPDDLPEYQKEAREEFRKILAIYRKYETLEATTAATIKAKIVENNAPPKFY